MKKIFMLGILLVCFAGTVFAQDTSTSTSVVEEDPNDTSWGSLTRTIFDDLLHVEIPTTEEAAQQEPLVEDEGELPEAMDTTIELFMSKLDFNRGRGVSEPRAVPYRIIEQSGNHLPLESHRLRYEYLGTLQPTCIVLHRTCTRTYTKAIRLMERFGFSVHFMIDSDGKIYQLMDSMYHRANAARGIDDHAIHIELVGRTEHDLRENEVQKESLLALLQNITTDLEIPINNYDVESKEGVFSHNQVKRRYGGVLENDPLDPGYNYMYEILEAAGGTFYNERQWRNRFSGHWFFHRTQPNIKPTRTRGRSTSSARVGTRSTTRERRGRGITTAPEPALPNVFATDSNGRIANRGRMRYWYYGDMELTGITLHFTANSSYSETIRVLENRGLRVHVVVAEDGTAYQSMDAMTERAAGAVGFNSHCIQIEIVGRNEESLLENEVQKTKVIELVKGLAEKYEIPKNNYDVDSNRGIFSHGQAKKRWGHSAWLMGTEFDPGEYYMQEILEAIGGTFYYDMDVIQEDRPFASFFYDSLISDPYVNRVYSSFIQYTQDHPRDLWKGRMSENWVFLPYPWTP